MTRKKEMPGNSQLLLGIIVVTALVAAVHLGIFSFRETEDSPCWIAVGKYLLGQEEISRVSPHCLMNPLIPGLAAFVSWVSGIPVAAAYLPLNLAALAGSGIMLYRIASHLANRKVATVAALLFLIDFHTQYYGFAAMPDAVTWFFELLLIYLALRFWLKTEMTATIISLQGFFGGLAVLVKMNLVFLLTLIPLGLFKEGGMKKHRLLVVYAVSTLLLPVLFYSFVYAQVGVPPWGSLTSGLMERSPTLPAHVTSFISAFLYTLPFMLIGLTDPPFKKHQQRFMLAISGALITPILIWPFVMSRFSYTLFPLLLPLAANGLWRTTEWMTTSRRVRQVVIGVLIIGLFGMGLLRMKLTLSNQTHLEYFMERVSSSVR